MVSLFWSDLVENKLVPSFMISFCGKEDEPDEPVSRLAFSELGG